MTKLAPSRAQGFVMGVWFLSVGTGNWMAGKAGSLYETVPLPTLFGIGAAVAIAATVLLAILVKPTKRLMGGVS
jgi:POT family proton-dependent oligopeptide transporter